MTIGGKRGSIMFSGQIAISASCGSLGCRSFAFRTKIPSTDPKPLAARRERGNGYSPQEGTFSARCRLARAALPACVPRLQTFCTRCCHREEPRSVRSETRVLLFAEQLPRYSRR